MLGRLVLGSRKMFRLSDYKCVALDHDNTLIHYNLTNLLGLQYELLREQMIKRGYNEAYYPQTMSRQDVDFVQRGLFMDFERGNVLSLSSDGTILRATHGTHPMSEENIEATYPGHHWDVTDDFCKDKLSTWNGPLSEKMRSFLDYTDSQASLVFARSVDCVDGNSACKPERYEIWPDLLESIVAMFRPGGSYADIVYGHLELYLHKTDTSVLEWLKELKKTKKTVLITGSVAGSVSVTGNFCLGKGWESLFDLIIYNAKKPAFFCENRPFIDVETGKASDTVKWGSRYCGGNWKAINRLLRGEKGVYVGDNLIQDIYAVDKCTSWDAVGLVEELAGEAKFPNYTSHPHAPYITSSIWGGFMYDSKANSQTVWGHILHNHAKYSIPTLQVLANKPLHYEFPRLEL